MIDLIKLDNLFGVHIDSVDDGNRIYWFLEVNGDMDCVAETEMTRYPQPTHHTFITVVHLPDEYSKRISTFMQEFQTTGYRG